MRYWSVTVSFIFLILGLTNSKVLSPLNKLWFKFGFIFRKNIFTYNYGFYFLFVVTPIAILMKLLKKDLLNLKFNNSDTYWIEKNEPKSKMKNQF